MTSRESYFKTDAGNVFYNIYGPNKANTPLLVVHGGPGAPHNYLLPLNELAENRPVIFYDQFGCGKSGRFANSSLMNLDYFIDELYDLINHLQIKSCHLLGQSWGTMIVAGFAAKYPDFAKCLTLSSPFLNAQLFAKDARELLNDLSTEDKEAIINCEKKGDFQSPDYQKAMGSFYSKFVCRLEPFPDFVNDSFSNLSVDVYNTMWGASEFTISGTLKDVDITNQLHNITIPVLLTSGEFDEVRPQTTNYYSEFFKNCTVKILQNASHLHNVEQKEIYNKIVSEFIKSYD